MFFFFFLGTAPNCFSGRGYFYLIIFHVRKLSALAGRVKWPVCTAVMIFQPQPQPAPAQGLKSGGRGVMKPTNKV